MFLVRLCLFVSVNLFLCAKCSIPVERLCANPTCTEPISEARGALLYSSPLNGVLGFRKNQAITIISKSKNEKDYWGAVIDGKRGYVPSDLVIENKVYYAKKDLIPVPGEVPQPGPSGKGNSLVNNTSNEIPGKVESERSNLPQPTESVVGKANSPDAQKNPIKPDKSFEVIEGTTFYTDEANDITPSSTVDLKSVGQTAAPVSANVKNKDDSPERATIPPEILNLNANYKEQTKEKESNFIIEKVKENDENATVESKDINADDEDEDDEDEEVDDEEDEDEDDDAIEDEAQESLDDQINKNKLGSTKASNDVVTSDGSKSTTDGMSAEATPTSTHSTVENVGGNTSQTVVNVVENSVTSKISASLGDSEIVPEKHQFAESDKEHPPPNVDSQKVEVTTEKHTSAWRMLNGQKKNFPSQPAPGSFEIKYGAPQGIMSGPESSTPEAVPLGSQGVPVPTSQTVPPEPVASPPLSQEVPPLPQDQSTELPPALANPQISSPKFMEVSVTSKGTGFEGSDSPKTPPKPSLTSPTSQTVPSESKEVPPKPSVLYAEQPSMNEAPQTQKLVVPETDGAPGAPQELPTEASFAASQNATDAVPQLIDNVTPPVTQQEPAEASRLPSQPSLFETPTIFSQFSVSADILPENSTPRMHNPSPTPETIHEKVEVTTEAFATPTEPLPRETGNQFLASEESKQSNPPDEVTPGTIQPPMEVPTEATLTPSFPPQAEEESKVTDQAQTQDQGWAEEQGLLDQIKGIFSTWFTSAPRDEEPQSESNSEAAFPGIPTQEKSEAKEGKTSHEEGKCSNAGFGGDCEDLYSNAEPPFWDGWIPSGWGVENVLTPSNTFAYLVVTAVTVLLFTLGHNLIEKRGKTGPLIAKINKLEHEFLVSSKECLMLKEEVQSLREKIVLYENSANDELVLSLQAELDQSKKAKSELEASIEVLQQELDAATEAGLDLNKMLSEVLTQKGGSESLLKSVESLQAQLDSQQRVIDEMTKKLGVKNQENEALQTALEAAKDKSESLEEQLGDMKHNLNLHLKEKEDLTRDLNSQINHLKTRIDQLGVSKEKDVSRLKKEVEELQKKFSESSNALTVKEEELKVLKESMKHLKGKGDVKLDTVFDVSRVKGELAKEVKENQELLEKLQKEESSRKVLSEQVKSLDGEMQKLKKGYEEAEQKKDEAEKKLEVLSTYFKEKETQLQKELGLQEALWAQKKGDEKAVYNMMKSLQEEVESYKSQNETLKKEILDQERGLKNQIATLEQKAHENWVAARQAERKLEESKQEMAQLRNRLTLLEKNTSNTEGKGNLRSSEELNGVEAVSPILHETSSPLLFPPLPLDPNSSSLLPPGFIPPPMFMPPPMGGFMPPPPFLPGDRRPPPLGRMSSPPLNNRFSPSSPADYPFERMSSPPLSPHGSNYRSPNEDREHYRHRTPPYPPPLHPRNWDDSNEMPGFIPISSQRDSRRDHKGSNVSSEHSSSESLDKSSRHSGRV